MDSKTENEIRAEKEIKVLGSLVKDKILTEQTATSIGVKLLWGIDEQTEYSFEDKVSVIKSLVSKGLLTLQIGEAAVTDLLRREAASSGVRVSNGDAKPQLKTSIEVIQLIKEGNRSAAQIAQHISGKFGIAYESAYNRVQQCLSTTLVPKGVIIRKDKELFLAEELKELHSVKFEPSKVTSYNGETNVEMR